MPFDLANCDCSRCVNRVPSDGFHRATKSDYARAAALQSELDYWMESRMGFDPRRDNPALDNEVERPRNVTSLKAFLASTRRKFPRAFGERIAAFKGDHQVLEFKPSDPQILQQMRDNLTAKLDGETPDHRPE